MYAELIRRFWSAPAERPAAAPGQPAAGVIYHCDACDVRGRGTSCWMCNSDAHLRVVDGAIDTRVSGNTQAHGPLPTRH